LIYEHGKFSAADTMQTAYALRAYAVGLSGYAAIKVLSPCFYALDRPRTPLKVSLLGIGVNVVLNVVLVKVFSMGHVGLAATTGILALVNFVQLACYLRREVVFGDTRMWFRYGVSVVLAAVVWGWVAGQVAVAMPERPGSLVWNMIRVGCAIGAGGAGYLAVAYLLRVNELRHLMQVVAGRMGRGSIRGS